MSNYYDEMMENDEDFRKEYDTEYDQAMNKTLNKIEDEDEREEVMEALSKLRYVRSTDAKQDCSNNLMRAKEKVRERREKNKDEHVENFLRWVAKEDGISVKEAKKKYKPDPDRSGFNKYGY